MMFFGPHAASPPKKTPESVDCIVTSSTTGISQSPKSMPRSRSIHGKAFSWPMARITSSQGIITVSSTVDCFAPESHSRTSNSIPTSFPPSTTKRFGAWFTMISTPSSSASSSSHVDALKYSRGRRAMTLMSVPPSRRDERQQSIAVLPTPMIRTLEPIDST